MDDHLSTPLLLAFDQPCPEVGALLVGALPAVHRSIAERARTSDLGAPTRCPDWSARELVVHLADAAEYATNVVTGGRPADGFDPNRTPNELVEARAGDPVDVVLDRLDRTTDELASTVARLQDSGTDHQVQALWGRPFDWRGLATHILWDAWLHRRDLELTSSAPPLPAAVDLLALGYGLYIGTVGRTFGDRALEATLSVTGSAPAEVRIVADRDRHRVEILPTAAVEGPDLHELADSLSGRGRPLAELIGGPLLDGTEGFARALQG